MKETMKYSLITQKNYDLKIKKLCKLVLGGGCYKMLNKTKYKKISLLVMFLYFFNAIQLEQALASDFENSNQIRFDDSLLKYDTDDKISPKNEINTKDTMVGEFKEEITKNDEFLVGETSEVLELPDKTSESIEYVQDVQLETSMLSEPRASINFNSTTSTLAINASNENWNTIVASLTDSQLTAQNLVLNGSLQPYNGSVPIANLSITQLRAQANTKLFTNLKTISGNVTSIPAFAFNKQVRQVTSVILPNVKSIGTGAFASPALEGNNQTYGIINFLAIPSVENLGWVVFHNQSKLKDVNLSKVTSIGYGVFFGSSVETVELSILESISERVFTSAKQLKNVNLPKLKYLTGLLASDDSDINVVTKFNVPLLNNIREAPSVPGRVLLPSTRPALFIYSEENKKYIEPFIRDKTSTIGLYPESLKSISIENGKEVVLTRNEVLNGSLPSNEKFRISYKWRFNNSLLTEGESGYEDFISYFVQSDEGSYNKIVTIDYEKSDLSYVSILSDYKMADSSLSIEADSINAIINKDDKDYLTGNKGVLRMDTASDFEFGHVGTAGAQKTLTLTNSNPNVQVSDFRTGKKSLGWILKVRASDFVDIFNSDKKLKSGVIDISKPTITSTPNNETNEPVSFNNIVLNSEDQTFMSSIPGENNGYNVGRGSWSAKLEPDDVKLTIPQGNLIGDYASQITWTLYNTPI